MGEDENVAREIRYDTRAEKAVKWGGWGKLHDETFVGARTRSVCEGSVRLGSAECTASSFDLGGVRKSGAHLTDEIFKAWTNIPIPLSRCLVEGGAPTDGVVTDQLLGHFALRCQIEFGPHDDNWYRLMQGEGGSDRESGKRNREDRETGPSR